MNPRAKARLTAALRMLRSNPERFGLPKNWRFDDSRGYIEGIKTAIEGLNPEHRDYLRELVDWVEEYENSPDPGQRVQQGE